MAFIVKDRVRDTTTTTGTGTITLSGTAPIKYRNFASVCATSDTFPYAIVQQGAIDEWEVGIGTLVSSTTFSRSVISSSNSNALVSFSAGTKDVMMVYYGTPLALRTIVAGTTSITVTNGDGVAGNPAISLAGASNSPREGMVNGTLAVSVAGNAITWALKTLAGADPSATDPVYIVFQNGSGAFVVRTVSAALSLTVSSGSTLGATNATAFRIWVGALDNAGTVELFAVNAVSGANTISLNSSLLFSTTAEGGAGAADSAQVLYSTTARTSVYTSMLGYSTYETGLTTAGTWNASPTTTSLFSVEVPLPGQPTGNKVRTASGATISGTTVIPFDATIPQNTEGIAVFSQAITPTSAANVLVVNAQVNLNSGTADRTLTLALFTSGANALAATSDYNDNVTGGILRLLCLEYSALAGSTSATTFSIRAGADGSGTTTINGFLGGVQNSYLEISELQG